MRVGLMLCVGLLGCGGGSPDPRGKLYGVVLISVAGGGEVTGTIGDPIDCTMTTSGRCKGDNSSHSGSVTANDRTTPDGVDWIFDHWEPFRSDAITSSDCKPDGMDLSQRTITLSAIANGQDCLAVFREAQLTDIPMIQIVMPEMGMPGDKVAITGKFPGLKPSPTPEPSPAEAALVMFMPGIFSEATFASSTEIDTTVPMGATTGPVSVFVPAGKATSPDSFTVIDMMMMGNGQCGALTDVKFDPATASCGSGAGETVTIPLSLTATVLNQGTQPLTVSGASVTVDLADSCHVSGIGSWMVGTGSAIPPGQSGTFTLTSTSSCMWAMGVTGTCEIVADVTMMTSCGALLPNSTTGGEGLVISVP
jgi:hypothetical protein